MFSLCEYFESTVVERPCAAQGGLDGEVENVKEATEQRRRKKEGRRAVVVVVVLCVVAHARTHSTHATIGSCKLARVRAFWTGLLKVVRRLLSNSTPSLGLSVVFLSVCLFFLSVCVSVPADSCACSCLLVGLGPHHNFAR